MNGWRKSGGLHLFVSPNGVWFNPLAIGISAKARDDDL